MADPARWWVQVRVYSGSNIHTELQVAAQEYLAAAVQVGSKIHLPKILQWYRKDFGTNAVQLLQWVADQMTDERVKNTHASGAIYALKFVDVECQSVEVEITFISFECVARPLVRCTVLLSLLLQFDGLHQSEAECDVTLYTYYIFVIENSLVSRIENHSSHACSTFLHTEDANSRAVADKEGAFQSHHNCLL